MFALYDAGVWYWYLLVCWVYDFGWWVWFVMGDCCALGGCGFDTAVVSGITCCTGFKCTACGFAQ